MQIRTLEKQKMKMKKISIRFFLISALAIAVIAIISFTAYKADNFWVNFSLNLLTEIIGALLIAVYLKTDITKGFSELSKEIKSQLETQRDIQKIRRAFDAPNPESAWNMLLEFKKRQLEAKKAELTAVDVNDHKKRNQIMAEMQILENYIAAASDMTANDLNENQTK